MSIANNPRIITKCTACGAPNPAPLLTFPNLPLTALFTRAPGVLGSRSHDQRFLFCERCSHGMLEIQLPPADLYGSEYGFRTGESDFGKQGSDAFLQFVERLVASRPCRTVVDVGCNDLYLLDKLAPRAERLLGIDPIWAGREHEVPHPKISVIGKFLEEVALSRVLGAAPDVILCRHTLEHIDDPRLFLQKLLAVAGPETLLIFEFPHLDTLLERYRFDHIFHQHVQYFSKHSFANLLAELGAEVVADGENPHHWDALYVAFRRGASLAKYPAIAIDDIRRRYGIFQEKMRIVRSLLRAQSSLVGFGAAQMLPVILYHLGGTNGITTVYDDDPKKDGLSYANLPVAIRRPTAGTDFRSATVLVTAPDSARPILRRLRDLAPEGIVTTNVIL